MTGARTPRSAALALGALALVAACGGNPRVSGDATATTTALAVVDGDPAAWASIEVVAAGGRATVPTDLRAALAPLLAADDLGRRPDLTEYGLATPVARLIYRATDGSERSVWVGGPTADRHGVHVMRDGSDRILVAPAGALRPVLALVGLTVPPA
jgi:hypothetical protein